MWTGVCWDLHNNSQRAHLLQLSAGRGAVSCYCGQLIINSVHRLEETECNRFWALYCISWVLWLLQDSWPSWRSIWAWVFSFLESWGRWFILMRHQWGFSLQTETSEQLANILQWNWVQLLLVPTFRDWWLSLLEFHFELLKNGNIKPIARATIRFWWFPSTSAGSYVQCSVLSC